MTTSIRSTAMLVNAYYESWQNGISSFDEASLRELLDDDLLFEGPIAGSRRGREPFMRGLADFVRSLRGMRMLQLVHEGSDAAALYDTDLGASGGTLRFAEFFHLEDERIKSIKLVYDPNEFRRLTAN